MSANSSIEWTEATWNPTLGCSKISPGCKGCYAIKDVHRMAGNPNPKIRAANQGLTSIEGGHPNWNGKVRVLPDRLDVPLRRKKPTRYFVNSLSDLFHEDLPDEVIDRVFAAMALCPQHTFQVLTKRAERMAEYFADPTKRGNLVDQEREKAYNDARREPVWYPAVTWPLPNVWLGVSAEDQQRADERIPHLIQTPAAVRFVSLEPLLGPIDIKWHLRVGETHFCGPTCRCLSSIDWVIVGGESGPGARPMHPDWVRGIRDQCVAAGVPFFFKQWGIHRWVGRGHGGSDDVEPYPARVGKKKAGRGLDGRTWDEMPVLKEKLICES